MTVRGYTLLGDWENSNCGKTAIATKGGKKYFLKKYQTVVAPIDNGSLDRRTIAHNQELFDQFVNRRKTVNTRIRTIAGGGGNIIIPVEEFIDGNQLVEASEFVEGGVPKEEMAGVLAGLDAKTKKLLMMTAAGALASVHKLGIIHSDLKLPNVLLVKNSSGNYVAKLIDFDSSYPYDDKPDEIVGTPDFYSPELGRYVMAEDYSEESKSTITNKTDIFSLGLIYHFYLTGTYPEPVSLTEKLQKRKDKGKVIYPYIVLNNDCELRVSPAIGESGYISLIEAMLNKDPAKRPTATEVLLRLKNPGDYSGDKPEKGGDSGSSGGGSKGAEVTPPPPPAGFEEPWPEHSITLNQDKLKSAGFVSGKRATLMGTKGYDLFTASGQKKFMKVETMTLLGYAGNKTSGDMGGGSSGSDAPPPPPPPKATTAEPWPEHKITFDAATISAKGYVSYTRATLAGVNGYEFTRSNGTRQFLRVEMVLMQKMARKI